MSELVRRAAATDAADLAGVSVRAWQHAYADILDPQVLAERDVESQLPRWEALLADSPNEVWLAEVAGRIAGYIVVGASTDRDAGPGLGMLYALYVDPPAQGAGLGTHLHAHALDRLRALGFTRVTLWVFTGNGLGRAFYERHGWEADSTGPGQEGEGWHAPALRYAREL